MKKQSLKVSTLFLFAIVALFSAFQFQALGQATSNDQRPPNHTTPTVLARPVATPTPAQLPAASSITSTTVNPDIKPAEPVVITQGLLVESLDGRVVMEQEADHNFNPASAVKLGTALAAIKTFGVDYRFTTGIWTTGTLDLATGTLSGDLIVTGRDPSFNYEHAVMVARELNKRGIRVVTGDLIVARGFTMNFDWSAQRSGDRFYDTLDASRRSPAATKAWLAERSIVGDHDALQAIPSVAVMGAVYVDSAPAGARTIAVHRSSKLIDVLKVMLCFSNNFMAERIGETLGGAAGIESFLERELSLNPDEIRLASASGLGVNRVTPRVMMKIFRALRTELAANKLTPSDILPVAGVDPGTLEKRYTLDQSRGSVIAKTGTLIRTDGGVSALVGQMRTRGGDTLLFVILNQRGNVLRFRENQDALITQIQNTRGGPSPFQYQAISPAMRLASTELRSVPAATDEYEPR